MRESLSGTALFMIVIFFVVLFTGYLSMSVNQNRAFAVKNAIVRIVERNGIGVHSESELATAKFSDEIKKELIDVGYRTKGICNARAEDSGWIGFDSQGKVDSMGNNSVFCIKYISSSTTSSANPNQTLHYFKVKTFYHFDIPILRRMFGLSIEGTTKPLM